MGIGDWGLGIGDWGLGQSPIPNPQSPNNIYIYNNRVIYCYIIYFLKFIKLKFDKNKQKWEMRQQRKMSNSKKI